MYWWIPMLMSAMSSNQGGSSGGGGFKPEDQMASAKDYANKNMGPSPGSDQGGAGDFLGFLNNSSGASGSGGAQNNILSSLISGMMNGGGGQGGGMPSESRTNAPPAMAAKPMGGYNTGEQLGYGVLSNPNTALGLSSLILGSDAYRQRVNQYYNR